MPFLLNLSTRAQLMLLTSPLDKIQLMLDRRSCSNMEVTHLLVQVLIPTRATNPRKIVHICNILTVMLSLNVLDTVSNGELFKLFKYSEDNLNNICIFLKFLQDRDLLSTEYCMDAVNGAVNVGSLMGKISQKKWVIDIDSEQFQVAYQQEKLSVSLKKQARLQVDHVPVVHSSAQERLTQQDTEASEASEDEITRRDSPTHPQIPEMLTPNKPNKPNKPNTLLLRMHEEHFDIPSSIPPSPGGRSVSSADLVVLDVESDFECLIEQGPIGRSLRLPTRKPSGPV